MIDLQLLLDVQRNKMTLQLDSPPGRGNAVGVENTRKFWPSSFRILEAITLVDSPLLQMVVGGGPTSAHDDETQTTKRTRNLIQKICT